MVRSIGSQRQASVMDREAGGITQHIGATEVPADVLNETCAAMLGGKNFKSPGLLFIDTPGHHSFASLRNRGGSVGGHRRPCRRHHGRPSASNHRVVEHPQRNPNAVRHRRKQGGSPSRLALRTGAVIHRIVPSTTQRTFVRCSRTATGRRLVNFLNMGSTLSAMTKFVISVKTWPLCPCRPKKAKGSKTCLAVTVGGLAERFLEDRLTDTFGARLRAPSWK